MIKAKAERRVSGCPVSGFVLPAIDEAVPCCGNASGKRTKILARLALIAEEVGWELPLTAITDASKVFGLQLKNHVDKTYPALGESLKAAITVFVCDESLQILIVSQSDLGSRILEPIVTPLEDAAKGLGWFVAHALCHQSGLFVYDPSIITQGMSNTLYWDMDPESEFDDKQYARLLIENWDEDSDSEDDEITDAVIQRLKDDYEGNIWPSEVISATGGHVHLAGRGPYPKMEVDEASQWLKDHLDSPLAKVVEDAISLVVLSNQSANEFSWDSSHDESEPIGALAFVLWNQTETVFNAVMHHEEYVMNGAETCMEGIARYILSTEEKEPSDEQLKQLVVATQNYLDRWHLMERLAAHFPMWSE